MKLRHLIGGVALSAMSSAAMAAPETYTIDSDGQHAFIQFKVSHLGYSYVIGTLEDFTGTFVYDPENPSSSSVSVEIDASSVNSSHAKRDKHITSDDFLAVDSNATASFTSTSYSELADGKAILVGDLTLRGITKEVTLDVTNVGAGEDPWGGYRRGFEATTTLTMADFGIPNNLGPSSQNAEMYIIVEGIRQ